MASSVDFQIAAYRGQALPGLPVVHGSAKKYAISTTSVKITVPTWTPANSTEKLMPALMKLDTAAGPLYIAFDGDEAVVPTTGADGSAAAPINQAMAVNNRKSFYLIAESAITVTISWYWA